MTDAPSGLGERGQALYAHLSSTDPARNVLALEAARCADRLDELDEIIQGKGVLNLMQFRVLDAVVENDVQHIDVQVSFQNVLAEARQQQMALVGQLKALDASGAAVPAAPPAPPRTGADMLAEARARREGSA